MTSDTILIIGGGPADWKPRACSAISVNVRS
jgi:hypothetical protein